MVLFRKISPMSDSPENKRPSQSDVARAAGVSPMTVSLSLRNHPSIPEHTRDRIRKVAEDLGYRPDPLIGKLMQQLRLGGRRRPNFSLCLLAPRPTKAGPTYQGLIAEGARRAAEELGFFFDTVEVDEAFAHPERLRRMLYSRGIEGVILGPQFPPADLSGLLDWSKFSTVSTSHSVLGPGVHRVVPNQFANALLLGRELNKRGLRRLGLLISRDLDERTGHRLDAAIQWLNHENGVRDLETLRWETSMPSAAMLERWVNRHRPDAIISDTAYNLEIFLAEVPRLKSLPMAATATIDRVSPFDAILENPEAVGAAAVDLLSVLFQRGERGIPEIPRTIMIEGTFQQAAKRQKGAKPKASLSDKARRALS
jgi:DNA-binding LacI/PurR family transcriptional regulator